MSEWVSLMGLAGRLLQALRAVPSHVVFVSMLVVVAATVAVWGWLEPRVRLRKLRRAGRVILAAETAKRLAEGDGTLVYDEYEGEWWWTADVHRGPLRAWEPARTREEAEVIVGEVRAAHDLYARCCNPKAGESRFVVGAERTLRALGERHPDRMITITISVLEEASLDWRDWMIAERCKKCGYELRGLDDRARCPECGSPRLCQNATGG